MFMDYLVLIAGWTSRNYALEWKLWDTPYKRTLFQLSPVGLGTEGTECGLLLTPSTVSIEGGEDRYEKRKVYRESVGRHWTPGCLAEQIKMLPTPQARDYKNSNSTQAFTPRMQRKLTQGWTIDLNDRIAMLPTPTTRDWKGARKPETLKAAGRLPSNDLESSLIGTDRGLKLQPSFVEYMLGLPQDYTALPMEKLSPQPDSELNA
jgi:hypothetical protein